MLNDIATVKQLIADVAQADADHARAFGQQDSDDECFAALGRMDDAIIALCAARPTSPEAYEARRAFLAGNLYDQVEGRDGMLKAVIAALFAAPDGWEA
jgi:hypothetical protein